MHQLHPMIEKFYLGILNYAGLEIRDDVITNKNEKLGEFMVDGKHIALPYLNLLKDPQGRLFFHLLNENYASPENAVFNLFKERLVLELNLRLSSLITSLIALCADPALQRKVTSGKLIQLISDIGTTEMPLIEGYLAMTKAGSKLHKEAFNFDVFLKKNGEVRGTPFAAIGKINFRMYDEIWKALDSPDKEYKVFGKKFNKKDLIGVSSVYSAIFPDIGDKEVYIEGTDNKIFRYLNALLKITYLVSKRMNEIADLLLELKEPALNAEEILSPLNWVECLEPLYGMATEIRIIPGQVDILTESKRMVVDETKAAQAQQQTTQQPVQQPMQPVFNPAMMQQQQQPTMQPAMQQQMQQPQQQRQLTPEEIVRGAMGGQPQMSMQMPMMQAVQPMPVVSGMGVPMVINPMMPQQTMMTPQVNTPAWVQLEMMKEQQRQMQAQMPQMQMPQGQVMQPMMGYPTMNPMLQQQLLQQQMQQMQPMQQVPGQIPINPLFAGQVRAPWN